MLIAVGVILRLFIQKYALSKTFFIIMKMSSYNLFEVVVVVVVSVSTHCHVGPACDPRMTLAVQLENGIRRCLHFSNLANILSITNTDLDRKHQRQSAASCTCSSHNKLRESRMRKCHDRLIVRSIDLPFTQENVLHFYNWNLLYQEYWFMMSG